MKRASKKLWIFAVLAVMLALSAFAGFLAGSVRLSMGEIFSALFSEEGDPTVRTILLQLRLPRILAAALAGAGLAVSGLLLQTATDNDLCSPNVIGVNAGAGFAVMICLSLFPMAFAAIPALAFAGAALTTLLVLGMSFAAAGRGVRTRVVLAGVAVGAFFNAGISFLSQLYPDALSSYAAFSAGGFRDVYAEDLYIPAAMILAGLVLAEGLSPRLNLLCLGDDIAQALGVRVKLLRFLSLLLASLLCGAVVSFAGLLGFAGLIVPHIARRLVGQDVRVLVPACILCGAVLVILSDLFARTLFAPAELPAGILMAVLGAPFFLYLLFRRRRTV